MSRLSRGGVRALAGLLGVMGLMVLLTLPAAAQSADPNLKSLVAGWYQGRAIKYYDFGSNSPARDGKVATDPIYAFIRGFDAQHKPIMVEGQFNVIDTKPGDPGYSDLWQVIFVQVPAGYVANTVKSKADVDKLDPAQYKQVVPGVYVNCPVVPAGTRLETGEPITQGWYKGQPIYYFDFGENPVTTAPIWVPFTGFNDKGEPQMVPGQSNIIDVLPGQASYSAFWEVNLVRVPADYVANSLKSRADVERSGYPTMKPGLVVNCPVPKTFAAIAGPATGQGELPIWPLVAGAVVLTLGLGLGLRRWAGARPPA